MACKKQLGEPTSHKQKCKLLSGPQDSADVHSVMLSQTYQTTYCASASCSVCVKSPALLLIAMVIWHSGNYVGQSYSTSGTVSTGMGDQKLTILGRANHRHMWPTTQACLSMTGNEYWPKCDDVLWLGSKGGWLIRFIGKLASGR